MSNKKEDWKKELGISEYPWSSEDDDEEEPSLSLSEFPVQRERLNGTSDPMLPGPSASTPADASLPTAAQRSQDRKDRDAFWAAINGPNRFAVMASSRHRSGSASGSGLARSTNATGLSRGSTGSGPPINGSGSGLSRSGTSSGLSRSGTSSGLSRGVSSSGLSRRIAPGITRTALNLSRSTPLSLPRMTLPDPRMARTAPVAPLPSTSSERYVNLQNILETRQLMLKSTANLISISRDVTALLKARRRRRSRSVGTPRAADDRPRQHRAPGGSFTAPPASKPIRIVPSDSDSSHDETEENVGDQGSRNPVIPDPPREYLLSASSAPAVALEEEIVEIDVEPAAAAETSTETAAAAAADVTVTDGAGDGNTTQAQDTTILNESNAEASQPHGVKRKREADDDDDHASVRDFNQSLLKLLECPVCLESMSPPLAQCRRGHLVCGKCRARLTACPVCRAAFSSVRNRAMEGVADMVRYPCRHGCSREVRLKRRASHEASCAARRYRCPAPLCCARPMRRHDLPAHAQNKHLSILKLGRKHELSLPLNAEKRSSHLVLVHGEVFHLRVEVDVRTWGLTLLVTYLGPLSEASKYAYQVVVAGQYKGRRLTYTRETHSDLENPGASTGQDCFHLTLEQALNYLRVKNRPGQPSQALNLTVEILQNEPKGSDTL